MEDLPYLGPPLEDDRLGSRVPTKGKSTNCCGGAVVEPVEHLVQALMAQGGKKGFAALTGQHCPEAFNVH